MTRHFRLLLIRFRAAAVIGAALLSTACTAPPPPPRVSPEDQQAIRQRPITPAQPGHATHATAVTIVHQLALPLDDPAYDAWSLVDESVLPPITQAAWHSNGLRVGILPAGQTPAFTDALPAPLGAKRTRSAVTPSPLSLIAAPPFKRPVTVDLTFPPRAVREEVLTRGTLQLLARIKAYPATPDGQQGLTLELIPHNHIPKHLVTGNYNVTIKPGATPHGNRRVVLTPRDPREKMLDGRLFEELAVNLSLAPGQVLVIGLYRPWPPPPGNPPGNPPGSSPGSSPGSPLRSNPRNNPRATGPGSGSGAGASTSSRHWHPLPDGYDPSNAQQNRRQIEKIRAAQAEDAKDPASHTPTAPPPPEPPPLPHHLGRAMMAAMHRGHPAQTLLLISVETLPPPGSLPHTLNTQP